MTAADELEAERHRAALAARRAKVRGLRARHVEAVLARVADSVSTHERGRRLLVVLHVGAMRLALVRGLPARAGEMTRSEIDRLRAALVETDLCIGPGRAR